MKKIIFISMLLMFGLAAYADRAVPSHQDGGGTSDLKNFRVVGPIYIIEATDVKALNSIISNLNVEIVSATGEISAGGNLDVTNKIDIGGSGSSHPFVRFFNGSEYKSQILLALQPNAGLTGAAADDMIIKTYGEDALRFGTNNTARFIIYGNGNTAFLSKFFHIDRAGYGDGFLKVTASSGYDAGFDLCEAGTDDLNWRIYCDGDDSDRFKVIDSASQPIMTFANSGTITLDATNGLRLQTQGSNHSILYNTQYSDSGTYAPITRNLKGRGTINSPAQILDGDTLGIEQWVGYDNTPELEIAGQFLANASGDWTATNEGLSFFFQPTANGDTSRTTIMGVHGDGIAIGGNGIGDVKNYELFVTGNIAYTGTIGAPSSRATKREIKPLTDPEKENLLIELDSLELQSFKYRTPKEKSIDDFEDTIEAFPVKDFVDFYVYDAVTDTTKNVPIEVFRVENRVTQTRAEKLEKYNARREAAEIERHYTITRTGIMTDDLPLDSPMFFERKSGRRDLSLDGTAQQTISYVKIIREEQLMDRKRINALEIENQELRKRLEALESVIIGGKNE